MSPAVAVPESRRCRQRALECRTTAAGLRVPNARDQMLRVAEQYERMARDAEQLEIARGLSQPGALVMRRGTETARLD